MPVLVAMLVMAVPANAAVNRQVAFQGRIVDNGGVPVPDGDYHVEFKLHDDPTLSGGSDGVCSGSCVWMETRTGGDVVSVERGLFSVQLGEVASLAGIDFDQSALYVSIRVGGAAVSPVWDAEMTPRQRLAAAPQAIRALAAEGIDCGGCIGVAELGADAVDSSEIATNAVGATELADNSVGSNEIVDGSVQEADLATGLAVPVGTVLPYWGTAPPAGYLLADGAVVSCATYPVLCSIRGAVGTTPLPDLRGRTPIGVDGGAGRVTTSNTLGASAGTQAHALTVAELPSHNHGATTGSTTATSTSPNVGGATATFTTNTGGSVAAITGAWTDAQGAHAHNPAAVFSHPVGPQLVNPATDGVGSAYYMGAGFQNTPGTDVQGTHSHNVGISQANHEHTPPGQANHVHSIPAQNAHSHAITAQGGGTAHPNLQPYQVVNYIIRVG